MFLNVQNFFTITYNKNRFFLQLWNKRDDPVLHILLRQWADILVIINPSIQFLHGITNGICDTLLLGIRTKFLVDSILFYSIRFYSILLICFVVGMCYPCVGFF